MGMGWGGEQSAGIPSPAKDFKPQFTRYRGDVDLPFHLVPELIKSRLTFTYDHDRKASFGDASLATPATGSTYAGGITLSTVNNGWESVGVTLAAAHRRLDTEGVFNDRNRPPTKYED